VELPGELKDQVRLFVAEDKTQIMGYIVEKQVESRSGPFKIVIEIGSDLLVKQAQVPNYPHNRGRQVRSLKFRQQFTGKGPGDPVQLGLDINAVSGATSSSQALTDGVRDALKLVQIYFGARASLLSGVL